jgi:hypothetical protein
MWRYCTDTVHIVLFCTHDPMFLLTYSVPGIGIVQTGATLTVKGIAMVLVCAMWVQILP